MNTLAPARRNVKATAILFAPSMVRAMQNPRFGFGLARERRLPVGPSPIDAASALGACPATTPTADEVRDHFEVTTLSPADYVAMIEDFASVMADRTAAPVVSQDDDEDAMLAAMAAEHDRYESQELAEMGASAPVGREEDFAMPAEVNAGAWAASILGRLRSVAPAELVSFAETIAESEWQYEGQTIRPFGPTLEELQAQLDAKVSRSRHRRTDAAKARRLASRRSLAMA